jgi:hypothetical protein
MLTVLTVTRVRQGRRKVNEDKTRSVSANAGFDFLGVHSVSSKRHAAGGEARSAQRTLADLLHLDLLSD